jgi:hypothetical protein
MGAVAVGALLFAAGLVIVAALVWQESKARTAPEYLLDEAAAFVLERLSPSAAGRLGSKGVQDLLIWGLEEHQRRAAQGDGEAPVYGSGDVLEALMDRSGAETGEAYDPLDIAEVIAAEGEYLAAIGAIGDPAGEVDT